MTPRHALGIGAGRYGWLLVALACRAGDGAPGTRPTPSAPEASARVEAPRSAPLALSPVSAQQVCASLGEPLPSPSGLFLVQDPKLRSTLAGSRGHGVELAFRYLGPTAREAKLRSGRDRRQLGLELLARDTCNLLYVMWRIEPASELVVSVKRNAAESTHAECENRGYYRLTPAVASRVPELVPGAEHRLRAEVAADALSVSIDGSLVWSGRLDAGALELSGKAGLRSDNARFEVLALSADVEGPTLVCDARQPAPR